MSFVGTAVIGLTASLVTAQDASPLEPLAAEPPIGGPFWTVVVPALLLVAACLATWMLYRRFSGE